MPQDTPRGVRDFPPADAISLKYIAGVAEEVFKRFGFYPLETPAIEKMDVLNAKAYGSESTKEIYKIDGEEEGLRYDFTVPLARYVGSNKDLPLPFKRYQIGTIWRRDEPQKMRYREFLQADVDIVGIKDIDGDAEAIAAPALVLEELGIRNYTILLNSRQILQQIFAFFKVPADKQAQAFRILDKMQKISREDAAKQLVELGIDGKSAESLLSFVEQGGSNDEKLQKVEASVEGAKEFVSKTRELLSLLADYKLNGKISLDLALARGIDYYTGFVWEFAIEENGKRLPSVGSGGRYDNLIGMFSKKSIAATGSSLGISRLFDLLNRQAGISTYAKVFIAYIGAQNRGYAITAANTLRGNGIYVDLNTSARNLSKQMEYASSLKIKNVIIIGDKEREAGKIKLRNMDSGEEELISLQEAIGKLR